MDTKFIEKKHEEHVMDTVDTLSNYFTRLHAILQITEKNLMLKIKNEISSNMEKIKANKKIFNNSMQVFEETILKFEENIRKTKYNSKSTNLIVDLMKKANNCLEQNPCHVQYDNFEQKFRIDENDDIAKQSANCLKIQNSGEIFIHISTYDSSPINGKSKKLNSTLTSLEIDNIGNPEIPNNTSDKHGDNVIDDIMRVRSVIVSHIKNPHEFYIQNEDGNFPALKQNCQREGCFGLSVNYIDVNETYLVSIKQIWHRARVTKILTHDLFRVFIIDTGAEFQIPKNSFRTISDDLRKYPPYAHKCSIYGIKPKTLHWTDEANIIMSEIIANQLIHMVLVKKEPKIWLVDLISTKNFPTSLRDALIHTDNALQIDIMDDRPLIRNLVDYKRVKAKLIPPIRKSFYGSDLPSGVEQLIIPGHIISPDEFYVIKSEDENNIEEIQDEIQKCYSTKKSSNTISVPRENMPCAAYVDDKWYRAQVISINTRVKCDVQLVDYGEYHRVTWKQLRMLNEKFLKINAYSIRCSLIDVVPIDGLEWPEEIINIFKRHLNTKKINILSHKFNSIKQSHKVSLFIVKPTMNINVNALLVHSKHAKSTGFESQKVRYIKETDIHIENCNDLMLNSSVKTQERSLDIEQKPKIERQMIKIIYVISPGEFYIHLQMHIPGITKLQNEIQNIQKNRNIKLDWKKNENCLVHTSLFSKSEPKWYRGTIVKIETINNIYSVYLRDQGETVCVTSDKISIINETYDLDANSALKCHLACCKPTNDLPTWSISSIDKFKDLIDNLDKNVYASIHGERVNNSIPIIIWGRKVEKGDPLSADIYRWSNLNLHIVSMGYAHLTEAFSNKSQICSWESVANANKMENIVAELKVIDEALTLNNSTKHQTNTLFPNLEKTEFDFYDNEYDLENMTDWLPAKPTTKTMFTGVPTYVDNRGLIFLHDDDQAGILEKIKTIINTKFQDMSPQPTRKWYIGQPCLARFHLDNLFYRAKIIEILSKENFKVIFVDYGNEEEITVKDLVKDICLTKVPIQANAYQLAGVKPRSSKKVWSREALDFIHIHIVLKKCTIRVNGNSFQRNDEIKKCFINVNESGDIGDLLIKHQFAIKDDEKILPSKSSINDIQKDYAETSSEFEYDSLNNSKDLTIDEVLRNHFQKEELNELHNTIQSDKNISENENDFNEFWQLTHINTSKKSADSETLFSDADDGEMHRASDDPLLLPPNIFRKHNSRHNSSFGSFDPLDTSTVVPQFEGLELFPPFEIPFGVREFFCEVMFIQSSLSLYVLPMLSENEKKYDELLRNIQINAKQIPLFNAIAPTKACLANYSDDRQWYRGLILSKNKEEKTAKILFVDYMNKELVKFDKIKKIPKENLKCPLRLLEICLHGIKPNPRWREHDIKKYLNDILKSKRIYCKIEKMGKVPEAQLYESSASTNLILQKMINEKFFFKLNRN